MGKEGICVKLGGGMAVSWAPMGLSKFGLNMGNLKVLLQILTSTDDIQFYKEIYGKNVPKNNSNYAWIQLV